MTSLVAALQKCFNAPVLFDFIIPIRYNGAVGNDGHTGTLEGCPLNENESITKWEERFTEEMSKVTEDKQEVANMDYVDFLDLLMESRIILAF